MPTSEIVKLQNVRLSFPRLWKPKSFRKGQEPRFESSFILDPSDARHAKMIEEIEEQARLIAVAEWGDDRPKKLPLCFGLAEDLDKDYSGYEGMWVIATATPKDNPPTVVDRGRRDLKPEPMETDNGVVMIDPKIPYAGCFVNSNVTLWTQDNEFGTRINGNLRIVQYVADGEAFGVTAANAERELDDLDDGDVDENLELPDGGDDDEPAW